MQERYSTTARVVHWLTAAMVLLMVIFGIWMTVFEPADEALKYKLYDLHQSTGITIFVLTLFRLYWRLTHTPPALPADLPPHLALAARGNHALMYALLLGMPVVGFLATNAWGFPVTWWGLIPLPDPVGSNEDLAGTLSLLHFWSAMLLILLVLVHGSAALWHHYVRKDGTLSKMA